MSIWRAAARDLNFHAATLCVDVLSMLLTLCCRDDGVRRSAQLLCHDAAAALLSGKSVRDDARAFYAHCCLLAVAYASACHAYATLLMLSHAMLFFRRLAQRIFLARRRLRAHEIRSLPPAPMALARLRVSVRARHFRRLPRKRPIALARRCPR